MFSIKVCIKTLVLLFFFFIANSVRAQEIIWQNTLGGNSSDDLSTVHQTTDGGYILGGSSGSPLSGDKTEDNIFSSVDFWIVKTDSIGNIQWQNTIGGSDSDELNSIQQTTDGGYIIGGTSTSNWSVDKAENSLGDFDYWVVKIDSNGIIKWQNTIGGSYFDKLTTVKQTIDGGYIVGGTSNSGISGDKTENSLGIDDYWIVKLDSLGQIKWQKTIGGNSWDYVSDVVQTSDGGYILGGGSFSAISGVKTEGNFGIVDIWIVKTDSVGNIEWQNTIGGPDYDVLASIVPTTDGGYVLGACSASNVCSDKTENSLGDMDYWLVKLNSLGNIEWQNTIGGDSADYLSSIRPTFDGGYILGGYSNSNFSHDKTEFSQGSRDYWVVKTDSLGNVQWQNTIGGKGDDRLFNIEQTSSGDYIIGGYSYSNISLDKDEDCIGVRDYWILKITGNVNTIKGHVFADLNGNKKQENGELPIFGQKIIEHNSGNIAFSNSSGDYSLTVPEKGSYLVRPNPLNSYDPTPAAHNVTFSGILQTDSLNDFAFKPSGIFDDVAVTITPIGNFRSGFNATYRIDYFNYGTTTVAPTVAIYPDNNLMYIGASVTPFFTSPDSVVWNLPSFGPYQSGSIYVNFHVNSGIPIGSLIFSSTHIYPYDSDVNQSNNNNNWEVYISGSLDPNDLLVSDDTLTTLQLANPPWLDYIIRFQNTGNDTAFTVKILNPIDTKKLKFSTFEIVNSSHPVSVNWINHEQNMEFKFENILMPDSNTNQVLSHGFVHYRIKPKSNLNSGYKILNNAAIYFDFNEPVFTNTAQTVIVSPTGLSSLPSLGKLAVYPNPVKSKININGIKLENGKALLRLFDLYGKLILEKNIATANPEVDVQYLPAGMYLLQSGNQRSTFVKQ